MRCFDSKLTLLSIIVQEFPSNLPMKYLFCWEIFHCTNMLHRMTSINKNYVCLYELCTYR